MQTRHPVEPLNLPLETSEAWTALRRVDVHDLAGEVHRDEDVAEEAPLAIVVNGVSQAVMMGTPHDLEDFALGFAFTEGLIERLAEVLDLEVEAAPEGLSLQLRVTAAAQARLKERRRRMSGRTGCGVCGIESLQQLRFGTGNRVSPSTPDLHLLGRAMEALHHGQELNARCGGLHAAAWCAPDGQVLLLREDVGRHNALDKVIGARLRLRGGSDTDGFVAISSRASAELVHKCLVAGVGLLASVSAPTALAVRLAREHGLALTSFVREGRATRYA